MFTFIVSSAIDDAMVVLVGANRTVHVANRRLQLLR
jgi:hypothetical protein